MPRSLAQAAILLCILVLATPIVLAQTVRMAVTDVEGLESLQREWAPFRDKLQALTGYEIEFFPVSNRTAAAEALDAERVDLVLTGPAEYVVLNKRTNAQPVVGFGRPDYFSGIIVLARSGIGSVAELKGRTVALGDVGSTSSHIAPAQLLVDYGIDPRQDISVIHTSEPIQWESLKRGDVDAVGMNYMSDFIPLREQETEFSPGDFKVIARGPDLPNDILVAGDHVDDEIIDTLRSVFGEHSRTLVEAVTGPGEENEKYRGMAFIPEVKDSDYDYIRSAYGAIGYPEYADFVGD